MSDSRMIFADGLMDASVTYGVVRLALAQTGPDGKPIPAGQLIVPLVQLPALANGLNALLKQIESRVKEQQAQQGAAAPAPAGSGNAGDAPAQVPGAFRFS